MAIVKLLLNRGADADLKDYGRRTLLLSTIVYGYKAIVELLLNKGVDTNLNNNDGRTPL